MLLSFICCVCVSDVYLSYCACSAVHVPSSVCITVFCYRCVYSACAITDVIHPQTVGAPSVTRNKLEYVYSDTVCFVHSYQAMAMLLMLSPR